MWTPVVEIEGRLDSSWYELEGRSGCDSCAVVAIEDNGACRFWLIGTC